jgi:hypothetical protein
MATGRRGRGALAAQVPGPVPALGGRDEDQPGAHQGGSERELAVLGTRERQGAVVTVPGRAATAAARVVEVFAGQAVVVGVEVVRESSIRMSVPRRRNRHYDA